MYTKIMPKKTISMKQLVVLFAAMILTSTQALPQRSMAASAEDASDATRAETTELAPVPQHSPKPPTQSVMPAATDATPTPPTSVAPAKATPMPPTSVPATSTPVPLPAPAPYQ